MLGHNEAIVRIGGIDALKRESRSNTRGNMSLLQCGYSVHSCAITAPDRPRHRNFQSAFDLQEAVKAISTFGPDQRGTVQQETTRDSPNLGGVRFFYATLWNFNFAGMDLRVTQFEHCNLCGTNFAWSRPPLSNLSISEHGGGHFGWRPN